MITKRQTDNLISAIVFVSVIFCDRGYAKVPVLRENIRNAVKGVEFKNFRTQAEARWKKSYAENIQKIAQTNGNAYMETFQEAVKAETAPLTLPTPLDSTAALDILCGPLNLKNQNPASESAIQLVRCDLNEGFEYKKTAFGTYLDALGPNDNSTEEKLLEDPFSGPKLSNGFRSMLSVNVTPPSPKLFKAWLMSDLIVFAELNSQQQLVTLDSSRVTFDERLIQTYLQTAFIDRANTLLDQAEGDAGSRSARMSFNTKTRAYSDGVGVNRETGKVSDLNFALIMGGNDQFTLGPGTFRFGGVVVDRSTFGRSLGSWSFPIQLFYYFNILETYREDTEQFGLAEFYIDLFAPVGTQWLAWGELFAYPGNNQVRSIGYWRNILSY